MNEKKVHGLPNYLAMLDAEIVLLEAIIANAGPEVPSNRLHKQRNELSKLKARRNKLPGIIDGAMRLLLSPTAEQCSVCWRSFWQLIYGLRGNTLAELNRLKGPLDKATLDYYAGTGLRPIPSMGDKHWQAINNVFMMIEVLAKRELEMFSTTTKEPQNA